MLMNIDCSIVQSIKVALTFDDNKTKEREISTGDLAYFEYNKNGKRKIIEGKVVKIGASDTTDAKSWFIVVDGSLDFSGQMERFSPTQILDCDILQKHDSVQYIATPNDSTRITDIRLCNGVLQVSIDGGYSWITPKTKAEKDEGPWLDNNPDQMPPEKPHRPRKKKRTIVIEEDPDDDDDDEYPDSDTDPDDSDDGDDEYPYDDGDDDDDDYGIAPDRIYGEVY